ncbi:MAG: DUF6252 family protein [Ferruginibacter sp.]
MKYCKLLFAGLILSLCFTSCKKNSPANAVSGGNGMSAKVDGASFSATLATTATLQGTTNKVLAFAGTGTDGQINVSISSYTGPGTYTISSTNMGTIATYTTTSSPFESYSASGVLGSGTITIDSDSGGYVKGSFSFSGKNNAGSTITSKEITDGSINIQLQ